MRRQILALAASVPLVLSYAASGANAQPDADMRGYRSQRGYGGYHGGGDDTYGYRSQRGYHGGGYGRGERGGDYGPSWRGRQGGGYGPGWRGEYGPRGQQYDDDYGPGRRGQRGMRGQFGMTGPGMMGAGMMRPGLMMRMMLTLMDTDNDGAISLSEFQAAHERMFKAVDVNKDGRVSIEEMQAWMQGRATSTQQESTPAESKPAQ